MTSENEYEDEEEESKEVRLLTDLRASVRSIDGKVEDILDELRDHFGNSHERYNSGLNLHDLYDDEENGY